MGPTIAGFIDSPEGRAAAKRGADEAELRGTGLVLVSHIEMSGTGPPSPEQEEHIHRLQASLQRMRDQLATRGLTVTTEVLQTTHDAGSALAQLCDEREATLLVIGLRQRSRVGILLLGSNAQKALMQASCAVLSVQADDSPD